MKFKKIVTIGIRAESLDTEYWAKIDARADKRVSLPKDSSEISTALADADCLLVAFGTPVTDAMIDAAANLRYIGVLATAYGRVDVERAKASGIRVSNIPGYSTEAVAEFSIAAILESVRNLEEGKRRGRAGEYSEVGLTAREIKGSVFGVIGLGSIGRRVAEIAHGFGADVRYWSREQKDAPFQYQDADTLIAEADFLSLNLAQTRETERFLNTKRVQSLKSGVVVVTTVPMELVDVDALIERLAVGDITFILDHADEVTKEKMAILSQCKNCIIYPPIAYITTEARVAKQKIFLENMENFLKGSPMNRANEV